MDDALPPLKGKQAGMSRTGAMSAYLTESLVSQTLLNHIRTSAISAKKEKGSEIETLLAEIKLHTD